MDSLRIYSNSAVYIKRINYENIPAIVLSPREIIKKRGLMVFFHGWSSSAEKQLLRAFIFANLGYETVLPEAVHHGTRGVLEYSDTKTAAKMLPEIIKQSVTEFKKILEIELRGKDYGEIVAAGHSMGGITAAAVFELYQKVQKAIIFNGSLNWSSQMKIMLNRLGMKEGSITDAQKNLMEKYDPFNNMEKINGRKLLILCGEEDGVLEPEPQYEFYEKAKINDMENVKLVKFPGTKHSVTSSMLSEAVNFLFGEEGEYE